MAVRTWANSLGIAFGAGLLGGAGQLGVAYGLGIVRWDREFATGAPWHGQLAWLAYLAIVAVVIGALAGAGMARRQRQRPTLGLRVALAFAAAIGATVLLPLVARPARLAHLSEPVNPRLSALLVVAVGLLIGIVVATGVLAVPPIAGSVISTSLWVWIAALVSAALTLSRGDAWASADLGLLTGRGFWTPVTLLLPAVLIALGVAAIARFGGVDLRFVAVCGLAGPAVVGLSYLVAGPGGGAETDAYRYALFAIAAGFAVSAVLAVVRKRPVRRRTGTPPAEPAPVSPGAPDAAELSGAELTGTGLTGTGLTATEPDAGPSAVPDAERDTESDAEPEPAPARGRLGAADYGWPQPEEAESESEATDLHRVELPTPVEPAPGPKPKPARKTARRKPVPEPAPVSPAVPPTADAVPAPVPPPAPEPVPEPDKPAKTSRLRRGRRQPEPAAVPATEPAKPAKVSRAQKREEDHVDWVRSLGGDDGIRVGGVDEPRHSKDEEF